MNTMQTEPFAAYVALCERKLVADRLEQLTREPASSWRKREVDDLTSFLAEVDRMVAHHRAAARFRKP